jgi:hypothetical protein
LPHIPSLSRPEAALMRIFLSDARFFLDAPRFVL